MIQSLYKMVSLYWRKTGRERPARSALVHSLLNTVYFYFYTSDWNINMFQFDSLPYRVLAEGCSPDTPALSLVVQVRPGRETSALAQP